MREIRQQLFFSASSRQLCNCDSSPSLLTGSFFNGRRSIPGTMALSIHVNLPISSTTTIAQSVSRAVREQLSSSVSCDMTSIPSLLCRLPGRSQYEEATPTHSVFMLRSRCQSQFVNSVSQFTRGATSHRRMTPLASHPCIRSIQSWIGTMMHSYALAIWLRSGGSILLFGMKPMGKTGLPRYHRPGYSRSDPRPSGPNR